MQNAAKESRLLFENLEFLSTEDVATLLRTTPNQIRKYVHRGQLKPRKRILGRRMLFLRIDVDKLLTDIPGDEE